MSSTKTAIGSIGCGSMGGALLTGLVKHGITCAGFDRHAEKCVPLGQQGVHITSSVAELVSCAEYILLSIKPAGIPALLAEIVPLLDPGKIVISLAAGVELATLRAGIAGHCPVVRVMPNTPALVGSGSFALCFEDPLLTAKQQKQIVDLFALLGSPMVLKEQMFPAFTAVMGCGPAYVFYMLEAVTQAAVTLGFSWKQAAQMGTELFLGSALLAKESGESATSLREQVCSPGGVTIAAINQLDRDAVRGRIMNAIFAAFERDKAGGKKDEKQ